jgi:two-component system phosphate regulon sensor histidine kinase PhoR
MKLRSFKAKLILSYVVVIIISFVFLAAFLDRNLEKNSLQNIKIYLVNQARLIESQITSVNISKEDTESLEPLIVDLSKKINCRITVISKSGRVIADSEKSAKEVPQMENHLYRPEVRAAFLSMVGSQTRYSSSLKTKMLYVAVPFKSGNEIIGVIRLALPLESVERTLWVIRKAILISLILALILAVILSSILASRTTESINRMINISRRFSEGDFSRRIIHSSKDEIGELAATLNKMAQDMESKIKEIQSHNQKLSAILSSMIEGIIVVDKHSCIVSVNPAIEKIFHVLKEDVEGRIFLEAIRNHSISEVINSVLDGGKSLSCEVNLFFPLPRVFEVNAAPIFDNNIVNGCLIVMHDITQLRRLETVRSDFVANVSHELKTPLTSIKGFIETLLEGALEDKDNSRDFLKIIQEHAQRLDSLVNDLLSLSYLESKEIALERLELNLREEFERVVSAFSVQLKKKNIDIKNEINKELCIKADKNRLEQVITNLIDNAIKYNKDGGFVKITSQELDTNIKIIIDDSGRGIPAKDIPRIFERFYRVDKARSRELGGTGLGLSIAKHIIELHNGIIGVESIEGLGSKFWFILPK